MGTVGHGAVHKQFWQLGERLFQVYKSDGVHKEILSQTIITTIKVIIRGRAELGGVEAVSHFVVQACSNSH